MPRPLKCRRVRFAPEVNLFKPAGIPFRHLDEVVLSLDELEALRLVDLVGMYQETAAQQMNVSRQTLGNILVCAHRKVADCLINGKCLKIEGGQIKMNQRKFLCLDCHHEWLLPFGVPRPGHCPSCQSPNLHRHPDDHGVWSGPHHGQGHRKWHQGRNRVENRANDSRVQGG